MSWQIAFAYPFSGFNSLTFTNCFASVYMYLEGIVGEDDYDCPKREGKPCTGCGNCDNTMVRKQQNYYFLLDTMSGRSSTRPDFPGKVAGMDNAPETIEFLMGFLGYGYRVVEDDIPGTIRAAIDDGMPVLARMRDESEGAFRVVIGYDGDALIAAEPVGAQRKPATPTHTEIAHLVCVTGETPPTYTLADALKRIRGVMVGSRDAGIWDEYMEQFEYWGGLEKVDFEEVQRRFKRTTVISDYNFNCHNFGQAFEYRVLESLKDPRLDDVCRRMRLSYHHSHTRNWQIVGLNECRDWSTRRNDTVEWGYSECVVQCLERLKQYDAEVLEAIEEAIAIVEGDTEAQQDRSVGSCNG